MSDSTNGCERFTETELDIAKSTDMPVLLEQLGYQVTRKGRYHSTKEMDSLRIKRRRTWFRYSENIGGDAISFLQHFHSMSFVDAVSYLLVFNGYSQNTPHFIPPPAPSIKSEDAASIPFTLPLVNDEHRHVYAYLRKRGIAQQVITCFLDAGLLFEDQPHHNCVFVGRDSSGKPAFACKRGTYDKDGCGFKGDVEGSDKGVAFPLSCDPALNSVHVFESPIDLMSYMTLYRELRGNAVALCCLHDGALETYLRSRGYDIRVLNLVNFSCSDGYNPFVYLRDDKDVLKLVNTLIQSTTPKGAHSSDPFWEKSETALLQALILLLFHEAPEYEQNFSMIMRILEFAEVKEDDEEFVSPLDLLFQALEREQPDHIAVKQYKVFKLAAGKTAKSILVSVAVRLSAFNLPQIKALTSRDDMDLYSLGEKKAALYAVVPDNDSTFNFLVSLLYAQAFQALYYSADQVHRGALPFHVHFILDEFASMPLPGFTRELATMRSRNISASTIIQNMAQIKELYRDSWETIPGNSDTILYLGGNEASTHKYISEALGKSTIDTRTHGQTKGKSGSYSTNMQITGRELLTPDEVRLLDNRYAILFIRGARPTMDLKYELTSHPNIRYSSDGGAQPYVHRKPVYMGAPLFAVPPAQPDAIPQIEKECDLLEQAN